MLPVKSAPDEATHIEFELLQPVLIQQRLEALPRKPAERRTTLERLFQEVGCGELSEQRVPGSKDPNVLCTLPGEGPGVIVVGAHFDADNHGSGAVDDWSGAALLPSLYQSLQTKPRRHRIVFIGFSAEEVGLVGSTAYVKRLTKDERAMIQAVVNLECLGLAPPSVWAHRADKQLLDAYVRVARTLGFPTRAVNVEKVGNDDSAPFLDVKVPVITFHSITQATFPILHSPSDRLAEIKPDQYYDAYHLAALYLAYIDAVLGRVD
jgi:Zn-dependent M28 family amino/carboxypeptidase